MQGHYPDGTPSQKYGYVQYDKEEFASKAIAELNGKQLEGHVVSFMQNYNYKFGYNDSLATHSG